MKRFGKHRGRYYLLLILTLVVGLVISIAWIHSIHLTRLTPAVTQKDYQRQKEIKALLKPEVKSIRQRTALTSDENLSTSGMRLIPIDSSVRRRFGVEEVGPKDCFLNPVESCLELYRLDADYTFDPSALLAAGPLYVMEDPLLWVPEPPRSDAPAYEKLLFKALQHSRSHGTDEEAVQFFFDSATLAVNTLWKGSNDWIGAVTNFFPEEESKEILATAPAEILREIISHIPDIRKSLPTASDMAHAVLRYYDSRPANENPVMQQKELQPIDDHIVERIISFNKKRRVMKNMDEELAELSQLLPAMFDSFEAFDPNYYFDDFEIQKLAKKVGLNPSITGMRSYNDSLLDRLFGFEIMAGLELYQREHDEYPNELSELFPEYLPQYPSRPPGSIPFVYSRIDDGFEVINIHDREDPETGKITIRRVRWFSSNPRQFRPEDFGYIYQTTDEQGRVLNNTKKVTLQIPKTDCIPSQWFAAGPIDWEHSPSLRALIEAPHTLEAFEAACGAPAYIVPASDTSKFFRIDDRFATPRGQYYFFRTTIHAEQDTSVWVRFFSESELRYCCGVDSLELRHETHTYGSNQAPRRSEYFTRTMPSLVAPFCYVNDQLFLKAGDSPIIIRLQNHEGNASFRFAIQDPDGSLPEGVWFE